MKPSTPLELKEGQVVEVTVDSVPVFPAPAEDLPKLSESNDRKLAIEETVRRIREAKTLEEMFAVMEEGPDDTPDDYDLCEALNENRRLAGEERMLFPPETKGIAW